MDTEYTNEFLNVLRSFIESEEHVTFYLKGEKVLCGHIAAMTSDYVDLSVEKRNYIIPIQSIHYVSIRKEELEE